jgi:23S rRNA pseudouridine2605 synthase
MIRRKPPKPIATKANAPISPAVLQDERIQKFLATRGIASRREIERWIIEERIKINGSIAKLGDKVNDRQFITIDNKQVRLVPLKFKTRILQFEKLPRLRHERWIMIGRLDLNTEGLLLFTTNGELAHRLMHPSYEIEREYAVRIFGEVNAEMINQLKTGVQLEDGMAQFEEVIDAGGEGKNHWYHVIIKEGRNREVRRLWEAIGAKVSRLIRIRFGDIALPRFLKMGMMEELEADSIKQLMKLAKLKEL